MNKLIFLIFSLEPRTGTAVIAKHFGSFLGTADLLVRIIKDLPVRIIKDLPVCIIFSPSREFQRIKRGFESTQHGAFHLVGCIDKTLYHNHTVVDCIDLGVGHKRAAHGLTRHFP